MLLEEYKQNLQSYKEFDAKYETMEKELAGKDRTIDELRQKVDTRDSELEQVRAEELQGKEELFILEDKIQNYQAQIVELNQKVEAFAEDVQCKQRKHESEINQERIKIEGMKRNTSVLETKNDELNQSMKTIYEEVMDKNVQIGQMEDKLK